MRSSKIKKKMTNFKINNLLKITFFFSLEMSSQEKKISKVRYGILRVLSNEIHLRSSL